MARLSVADESRLKERSKGHLKEAERRGAPDARMLRVLAQREDLLDAFVEYWDRVFYSGVVPHTLKELIRIKISWLHNCGY
ncbi:MAG: hypothetical protein ACE5IZ_02465 [Dehalococcoidia bacterium]